VRFNSDDGVAGVSGWYLVKFFVKVAGSGLGGTQEPSPLTPVRTPGIDCLCFWFPLVIGACEKRSEVFFWYTFTKRGG
jgi:hypothetical protein